MRSEGINTESIRFSRTKTRPLLMAWFSVDDIRATADQMTGSNYEKQLIGSTAAMT
jgi:hypothetical protein